MAIRIDHPIPEERVFGDGFLVAWGDCQSPHNSASKAVLSWSTGSITIEPVQQTGGQNGAWACVFSGVPKNVDLTLTMYGYVNLTLTQGGVTTPFQCRGHFEAHEVHPKALSDDELTGWGKEAYQAARAGDQQQLEKLLQIARRGEQVRQSEPVGASS